MKEEIEEYLKNKYADHEIESMVETEIIDWCWVDDDWEENDDYSDEYE